MMKLFRVGVGIASLLLTYCTFQSYIKYTPDKLPDAKVGQPYSAEIKFEDNSWTFCRIWIEPEKGKQENEVEQENGLLVSVLDPQLALWNIKNPERLSCTQGLRVEGVPFRAGKFYIHASGYEPRTGGELIPIFSHHDLEMKVELNVVE